MIKVIHTPTKTAFRETIADIEKDGYQIPKTIEWEKFKANTCLILGKYACVGEPKTVSYGDLTKTTI